MNHFEHLCAVAPAHWRQFHQRAVAEGRGQLLDPEAERLAAADELVALTLPEFASLAVFAVLTEAWPERGGTCEIALSRRAASVLRLVDRALATHGRDHGYSTTAWLEHALHDAHVRAYVAANLEPDELPISMLVEAAAQALADAVIAFPRDRLGVPEALTDALGSLLDLYALANDAATPQ